MTASKHEPKCRVCRQPWVSSDGKWQICEDCPYREVDLDQGDDAAADIPQIQIGEEITVTLNLPVMFRRMAEQAVRIRELERELAIARFNALFESPDDDQHDNGDSTE